MDREVQSGATERPKGLRGELLVERSPDWKTEIKDFGPEGPTHLPRPLEEERWLTTLKTVAMETRSPSNRKLFL